MDLKKVETGAKLTFRCGGKVIAQKVTIGRGDFPIKIQIEGYHLHRSRGWSYSDDGQQGEGTGPLGKEPFDIMRFRNVRK